MCTVAAFISEEAHCKEFKTLCQSYHQWGLNPNSQVLTGVLFIWSSEQMTSSGEFDKAFSYGLGRELEGNLSLFTLTQIMRTLPLLLHSFSSSHLCLPASSPWNHHGLLHLPLRMVTVGQPPASPWYVVLIGSLCTYHSVEKNRTQRETRAFYDSTSYLALWHWWLKLSSGLNLLIQYWSVCCLKTPQNHCAPVSFIVFLPSLSTFVW